MPSRRRILMQMAAVAGGAAVRIGAQDQPAAALAQPEFEVASVKPHTELNQNLNINFTAGGGLTTTNAPLRMLITFAYNIRDHQLTGGPRWVDTERWDIVARPSHEAAVAEPSGYSDAASDRRRLRLRALLASRFQLSMHPETKEMPIYELMVAKGGPHLEPTKPQTPGPQIQGQRGRLTCKKVSMKLLAEAVLAQRLGRSVVDKTGLAGDFDFELKYVEDTPPRSGAEPEDRPTDPSGPSLAGALQEQLGLKLEPSKGPVDMFVIDRVERASEN